MEDEGLKLIDHILDKRVNLRNCFVPKIIIFKDGTVEFVYPKEYIEMDNKYQKLQDFIREQLRGNNGVYANSQDIRMRVLSE